MVEKNFSAWCRKRCMVQTKSVLKALVIKGVHACLLLGRKKLLQNMDRDLSHANQITPSTNIKWTVLVQVIERRNARKKANGPLYRNYVVTDTQGTKLPIVVFDGNVAHFGNTLMPFKRYYISNAVVKETPPLYKVLEYPYTWTLYRKNLVEPHIETIPPPLPCAFVFDRFSDFYQFADQERSICIKALVVQAMPVQQRDETSSTRDFIVINEEMIPMLMKAWDDLLVDTDVNVYARYKVPTLIVAYNLKVTTEHGLSLKTKSGAYILEDPPLNEELPLKEWYTANAAEITSLIETRAYKDTCRLFHPPRRSEILPLNFALSTIETVKALWTEGKLAYLPGQRKLWFEACAKCLTALDVGTDWKIMCPTCQEFTSVCVRTEIVVRLKDGPIYVEGTLKSPEIEKLLPFTSNELKIAAEGDKPLTAEVETALKDKHVVCFLKYYDRESRGILLRRYPIVKIYTQDEIAEYNATNETSANAENTAANPPPTEHIGSSSNTPQPTAEKQFLTPTTKTVLEEVSGNPVSDQPQAVQQCGTKRKLAFEKAKSDEAISEATTEVQNSITITPSKKSKGKDKEK